MRDDGCAVSESRFHRAFDDAWSVPCAVFDHHVVADFMTDHLARKRFAQLFGKTQAFRIEACRQHAVQEGIRDVFLSNRAIGPFA